MKVAIVVADSNGRYPVPAVKGGAVSTLVEHLIEENSIKEQVHFVIITYYDKEAKSKAAKYKNVEFRWVKIPHFVDSLDQLCFKFVKTLRGKQKSISFKSIFSLLWFIMRASSILKKETFDKLVLENNIPIARIIKISGYRGQYYYHLHNVPRISGGSKDVFRDCSAFLCVSQYVADQISEDESAIGQIAKEKTKVLYNCVDTKRFCAYDKQECRKEYAEKYDITLEDKIIIFVGRLSAEKGVDKLLEAVSTLNNVKVLIVGSYMYNVNIKDKYQQNLKSIADKLGKRVIFTGYISQDELPRVYSVADIAVLPSVWDEPAGLTMIEAMACGIPVITTNSGGIPEYVGSSAYIIEKDENLVDNLAVAINSLLYNDDMIKKMGQESREKVDRLFNADTYLDHFLNCLSEEDNNE